MQHVGPTSSNIVVSNMLGPFEHHVGYCCIMLYDVGSSLILFKLFIQHLYNVIVSVETCIKNIQNVLIGQYFVLCIIIFEQNFVLIELLKVVG